MRHIYLGIIVVVAAIALLVSLMRKKQGDEVIRYEKINGKILEILSNRKGILTMRVSNRQDELVIIPRSNPEEYYASDHEFLNRSIKVGDSIYKPSGVDSVWVFQDNNVYRYALIVTDK